MESAPRRRVHAPVLGTRERLGLATRLRLGAPPSGRRPHGDSRRSCRVPSAAATCNQLGGTLIANDDKEDCGMTAKDDPMNNHTVVSHEEWLTARRALLEQEKAFTRQCDEMSLLQRSLPWERVEKSYIFDGPNGKETLA